MTFKDWFTQEYDRDLEQRIKSAMQFSMSHDEKAKTRDFLASYIRMHPARPRIRTRHSWFSWAAHPYPIIAGLLIVALGGGSAGAASLAEQALPGDLLYPIKVNVNEEVRAAFASTPEKKADIAIERAERRIEELNTLNARGEVSDTILAQIDERIDEHVHKAEEETDRADDGDNERRLVAMLRVHENLIAASEIGGTVEPDVTFASVAADAPSDTPQPEVALMAAMPEDEPVAASAPAVISEQAPDAEPVARVAKGTAQETGFEAEKSKSVEKRTDSQAKGVERLRKTAEQRIDSLKKLLERKGNRYDEAARTHAQSELTAALAALEEGNTFLTSDGFGDATVRFNAAIRIAIDAREFLVDAPKKGGDTPTDDSNHSRRSVRDRGDHDD